MALDYILGLSFQRRRMEKDSSRWVDLKYQKIKQKKNTARAPTTELQKVHHCLAHVRLEASEVG